MLGENVAGTVLELGKQIKQQASKPLPAGDAEGSVFVDFLGTKMVSTSSEYASRVEVIVAWHNLDTCHFATRCSLALSCSKIPCTAISGTAGQFFLKA